MLRRSLTLPAAVALALGLTQAAGAAPAEPPLPDQFEAVTDVSVQHQEKGVALTLGTADAPELYIVQLEQAAVPAYGGGIDGLSATGPEARGSAPLDPDTRAAEAYAGHLEEAQAELVTRIDDEIGRAPDVAYTYTYALNGIAVELTSDEARAVAELPGVTSVQVDTLKELQTDVGPEWIGAPSLWDGSATPDAGDTGTKGEGVVVGVIDTGINPANPSFADVVPAAEGGDGFDHTNPRGAGSYVGVCDPANPAFLPNWGCNDKLIGAWDFTSVDGTNPYDSDGHGSHTASTSAGNQVSATTFSAEGTEHEFSATRTIKGVAPHANVIAYDACAAGCPGAATLASINQAIIDGVDVINYSIGSPSASPDPWSDTDSVAFLNARATGIYVATSAGNEGPGAATTGSPGDVPWVTAVGAAQHNRQWQAEMQNLTADGGATLPAIRGQGFSGASDGTLPLVDAGDLDNPLCLANGFPAGTDFTGQIVVCDRGGNGRVEKGQVVGDLGAAGFILANDAASGTSLNADAHVIPAVHISFDDGVALKAWMASVTGERGSLSGGLEVISDDLGDIMASFSSRGPNRAVELISPAVTAPGVDVLAANGLGNEVSWGFISGTSMASPHVAGSYTLLKALHGDDWTPAEAQSALMTTSITDVTDNDGTPADWFDMGSGRVDLNVAAMAGLVLDVTPAEYAAADPSEGGDVKELNTASLADRQCLQTCEWTRTVTGTSTGAGTWTVSTDSITDGIDVTVEPSTFTIAEGQDIELTITADVSGSATDAYQLGNVVLTPAEGSAAPVAHLPVAALPSNGVLPDAIDIDTRRDAGSQESDPIESIEIEDFTATVGGLVPVEEQQLSIVEDSTNTDPYDGNGTVAILVDVPADTARLVAQLSDSTAPDLDLFVGTGDTPSLATQVCSSATGSADEFCDVGSPEAGTWWILVQNWQASAPGGTDTVTLGTAVVTAGEGNLTVEGPETQPLGEPFTVRAFYDEPDLDPGETWFGAVALGSSPDTPGNIGVIPVTVERHADDVTKTASVDTAGPGDTIRYTLTVAPNVTPEDLAYTITDTLPEGTTYVEGSATEGATVEDGVLSWSGSLPTPVGAEGSYTITTSATNPQCVNPVSGTQEYSNLQDFGILAQAGLEGDDIVVTALGSRTYGHYDRPYAGVGMTDDGFLIYDWANNDGLRPDSPQSLPTAARPNNLAALLWQDMEIVYNQAANSGLSVATAGAGIAVIEVDDLRLAGDPTGAQGTYDMEAFLFTNSNDLVFAYDNLTGPLAGPITVGTENLTGTAASSLVNAGSAAGVIANDTVVCADYAGPDLDPVVITYDVTVDGDVADGTVLTNSAVHVNDNPGAQEVTVSDSVTVSLPAITVAATADAVEPATDGALTFTRPAGSTAGELTVTYSVENNRYTRPGRDYEPLDGTVTFAPGQTTAVETVGVIDRRGPSPRPRAVTVTVSDGAGYVVGDPAAATVDIVSDGR
ncbi:S8 family serine peptidase [Jiangella alkaliphila]|uniref:Conserved repeat domain-containing protein n=1 Tax=Jiangella alkaliphila TaxID=419479 RepID=A0A1H2M286_9ACTN|nr:S8 family serine peptidase [Jiangella alkaliphila]SDU87232.1 conserved repeat domain-containing protein [Jiangella alkaliphila]